MKTINTCLPIYDRISKQCFERSKGVGGDTDMKVPTITPLHRLPSFQWNAESDNMGTIKMIEMIDETYTGAEVAMATGWTNVCFDTLTTVGLNITSAISSGGDLFFTTSTGITFNKGDIIRIRGTFTLNSGALPELHIFGCAPHPVILNAGAVDIILVAEMDYSAPGSNLVFKDQGATNFSFANVTVTKISDSIGVHAFFQTLPTETVIGTDSYYIYNGETLKYLLPIGLYYLKITMDNGHILYSDWFLVDCVFENLITAWTNVDYHTFITDGSEITSAREDAASGHALTNTFPVILGETITLDASVREVTAGSQNPTIGIYSGGVLISNLETLDLGTYPLVELNEITFTTTAASDNAYIYISNTGVTAFVGTFYLMRNFSKKYIFFTFEHSCDLGDISYEGGFQQVLYLESENMEPIFPYTEKGAENGYGLFVPTFQRQEKNYILRTKLIPQYIVEVLHRLKLHDTIVLTDLVGDEKTVREIEVEHDWQFEDKYYALATITVSLGDEIIVTGCCTAVNECS